MGLVVPTHGLDLDDHLLQRLRDDLTAAGAPLVLCPVAGPLGESLFLDLLLDGRLGALVVTAAHADDPALAEVARTGRAVVAVDVERPAPGMVSTTVERAAGAVLAAVGVSQPALAGSVK